MNITVVVLTKNEEKKIIDCLESLQFADEILVIDDESTDRTVDLVKKLKDNRIKIYERSKENDFSNQRNFALSNASNDWVLFVDADERITVELASEIKEKINKNEKMGYMITRVDSLWGKKMHFGEVGNVKLLRLGKKSAGRWVGKVHEVWNIDGEIESLLNPIIHFPHENVAAFISDINYYSTIRAQELYSQGVHSNFFTILAYPVGKFIYNYLVKQGFKDEIPGFLIAAIMSMHSFLVRAKLYLLWRKS